MQGWLIVNSFIRSAKFDELYEFFKNAAEQTGVDLTLKKTDELLCDVSSNFQRFTLPDFVLFWDKDVYLARRLERAGIRVFNAASAIEICDNKILTALCMQDKVPMPKTIIAPKTFDGVGYTNKDFLRVAVQELAFPMVIKEACGSFGQQVYLAGNFAQAEEIIDRVGSKEILLQQYVRSSHGRDVRVNVVGGRVVSAMLRFNENDFRSNISNGGKMQKYTPTKAEEEVALKACEAACLDFAGVDILFGENDKPLLCEINSNPHFKSSYVCTGVDVSLEIMRYIVENIQ